MIDLNQCGEDRESNSESTFKSASAPTTPTSQTRQMGLLSRSHMRGQHRVNFPEDSCIVTGYFEAPNPYQYGMCLKIEPLLITLITIFTLIVIHLTLLSSHWLISTINNSMRKSIAVIIAIRFGMQWHIQCHSDTTAMALPSVPSIASIILNNIWHITWQIKFSSIILREYSLSDQTRTNTNK